MTAAVRTAFVSHEDTSRHDTGWNHPDHQGRLPAIVRAVQRDMLALWEPLRQMEAVPATEDDLLLVHTAEYVDRVREKAAESAREERTLELGGVPVSGASWDAALASVGTALTAVDAVLACDVRNGFALARPPGRGADADAPGEFSLFNTVAIAARHLRARRGVARVLVVAWGALPPAALARVLAGDDGIQLISIHQHPQSFPDPRAEEDDAQIAGVALLPGSGGPVFAAALRDALEGIGGGRGAGLRAPLRRLRHPGCGRARGPGRAAGRGARDHLGAARVGGCARRRAAGFRAGRRVRGPGDRARRHPAPARPRRPSAGVRGGGGEGGGGWGWVDGRADSRALRRVPSPPTSFCSFLATSVDPSPNFGTTSGEGCTAA
jgi:hypothetical protein